MPPSAESKPEQIIAKFPARLQAIVAGSTYWYTVAPENVRRQHVDLNSLAEIEGTPIITYQAGEEFPAEIVGVGLGKEAFTLPIIVRWIAFYREKLPSELATIVERGLADVRKALRTSTTGGDGPALDSLIVNTLRIARASRVVETGRAGWIEAVVEVHADYVTTV